MSRPFGVAMLFAGVDQMARNSSISILRAHLLTVRQSQSGLQVMVRSRA
ncbi:hypothetical protein TELCIR_26293 [Teladorsagia circumcincta]|uniref:Uncharacterized protein n=1 Tax=Teladorsagia circumcincta TaxID=45464 RepID=A0A2G9T393_TELCI|nr:hypothetical protein TELCIR_26293 [Teladorsagia circumcincta]